MLDAAIVRPVEQDREPCACDRRAGIEPRREQRRDVERISALGAREPRRTRRLARTRDFWNLGTRRAIDQIRELGCAGTLAPRGEQVMEHAANVIAIGAQHDERRIERLRPAHANDVNMLAKLERELHLRSS